MPDREKIINALGRCESYGHCEDIDCPYYENLSCLELLRKDALELLKPRLITADDFKNADTWGWIPAWCEEKDGSSYWEMITVGALEETKYQYWTARPTEEQRKEVTRGCLTGRDRKKIK